MKKLLAILFATLIIFSFTACGKTELEKWFKDNEEYISSDEVKYYYGEDTLLEFDVDDNTVIANFTWLEIEDEARAEFTTAALEALSTEEKNYRFKTVSTLLDVYGEEGDFPEPEAIELTYFDAEGNVIGEITLQK